MKCLHYLPTILVLGLLGACNKPLEREPDPTPTPTATPVATPVPTPNPAVGASQQAVRLYPDLAKRDSIFNKTFRELYEEQKKENPESLTTYDWPLRLAEQTAQRLNVKPIPLDATPTPEVHQASWFEKRLGEPHGTDKPAYNQRQSVPSRTYYYDSSRYRQYWIDQNGYRHYTN